MGLDTQVGTVIADDEPRVRNALVQMLADTPYVILASVPDGESLVEAVTDLRPRLALVDMNMPSGGVDAIARVRAASPETIVIAMSAEAAAYTVSAVTAAGAAAFHDKLGTVSLIDLLDEVFGQATDGLTLPAG